MQLEYKKIVFAAPRRRGNLPGLSGSLDSSVCAA
jgi:hypothetical protein